MIMRVLYPIFYALVWVLMLPPLRILYVFSDILYLLIYHLIKYRREVVRKNLQNSFPEKTEKELLKIERDFYHHFCDYFIETLKLINISDKEIKKRVQFINADALDANYKNNQSVFLYLGHYGNWEWLSLAWFAQHPEYVDTFKMYPAYYPLSNEFTERFMYDLRTRSKSVPVPQKQILRAIIKLNRENEKGIFIFIADQSPMWNSVQHWVTFLNQDTATIVAPEKLAKQTGYPVFYIKIRKIKRGHYSSEFIKLVDEPNQIPEFEITERYMDEMQKTINEDPAYWLWTHKRWKFVKAAFEKK